MGVKYNEHEIIDLPTGKVVYRGNANENVDGKKVTVIVEGQKGKPINTLVNFLGQIC